MNFLRLVMLTAALVSTNYKAMHTKSTNQFGFGFIEAIRREKDFNNVLYLAHTQQCNNNKSEFLRRINHTRIILTEQETFYLMSLHNKKLLAIVCMDYLYPHDLLQNLSTNLNHMRSTRVLIMVQVTETSIGAHHHLIELLQFLESQNMLNVVVIFQDFQRTNNYYAYRKFPHFMLEKNSYNNSVMQIYPNRLQNLLGSNITTLPDNIEPRTLVDVYSSGNTKISGYVWFLLETFAQKLNATLVLPFPIKPERIFNKDLLIFTRNKTIDISASIIASNHFDRKDMSEYSYGLTAFSWCIMLPQEWEIASKDVLLLVIFSKFTALILILEFMFSLLVSCTLKMLNEVQPSILDTFLHDSSIRGVLGQSIPIPNKNKLSLNVAFVALLITGMLYTNVFVAHLNTFITRPPLTKRISSWDDLLQSNLKVLMYAKEFEIVPDLIRTKYRSIFHTTPNLAEVVKSRNTLNTSRAFVVAEDRWLVFDEQQRHFARRLFRYSNLCFNQWGHIYLMIQENSIYQQTLDNFIHELNAAGFIEHWTKTSFLYMLQAKRVSIDDWSHGYTFKPVQINDLYWLWMSYFVLIGICLLSFAGELGRYYWT